MTANQNGWNEWSKHIIKELERLNASSEKLREDLQNSNLEITKLQTLQLDLVNLKKSIYKIKSEVENSAVNYSDRSEDQLKEMIGRLDVKLDDIKSDFIGHSKRISKLENYKFYLWGIGVTIVFIIGTLIAIWKLFD